VKDLAGPSLALTAPTIDAAWEGRVEAVIDTKCRLKAVFIGRDDLTASKLAASRLRDLAHVEEIREAGERRRIASDILAPTRIMIARVLR